eukprot:2120990-Amphidinium_carterae.1
MEVLQQRSGSSASNLGEEASCILIFQNPMAPVIKDKRAFLTVLGFYRARVFVVCVLFCPMVRNTRAHLEVPRQVIISAPALIDMGSCPG